MAKKTLKIVSDTTAATSIPAGTGLKSFRHDFSESDPDFSYTRYWYPDGADRVGITPWIEKKCVLGDDHIFGKAAKVEVLLPPAAPSDYALREFLTKRFDETLPDYEKHAFIQAKILLGDDEPWHAGYERVRGFARSHFAQRFATILIAHVPSIGGLTGYGNHVHCVVLARPLTINGFAGACTMTCSDRGYGAARDAWRLHSQNWDPAA